MENVCDNRINDIRSQVEARVEAEDIQRKVEEKKEPGPDDKFFLDCFYTGELGHGIAYAYLHRNKALYVAALKEWFVYKNHAWGLDVKNESTAWVENVVEKYFLLIRNLDGFIKDLQAKGNMEDVIKKTQKEQGAIWKVIKSLRKVSMRKIVLEAAMTCENPLVKHGREFDQLPYKMAVANGVLNLKLGECQPGDPEDLLSKTCPTKMPENPLGSQLGNKWKQFLLDIMGGDQVMVDFLQRLLGLAIIGKVIEHIFVICTGSGRNGKTTLFEVLMKVLGPDMCSPVRPELILDTYQVQNPSAPNPEISSLRGKRVAIISEIKEGSRASSYKIKQLTGGDALTGRGPYDRYAITFDPSHTLFLLSNYLPDLDGNDKALRERIITIPFNMKFVDKPTKPHHLKKDRFIIEKLLAEKSAILSWLVEGCLIWQMEGLNPPQKVRETTEEYLDDEDVYSNFIEECLIQGDDLQIQAAPLHDGFCKWWKKNISNFPPKQARFGRRMKNFFIKDRSTGGNIYYFGIDLKEEWLQTE
jgi:putative DNA primase/helicase